MASFWNAVKTAVTDNSQVKDTSVLDRVLDYNSSGQEDKGKLNNVPTSINGKRPTGIILEGGGDLWLTYKENKLFKVDEQYTAIAAQSFVYKVLVSLNYLRSGIFGALIIDSLVSSEAFALFLTDDVGDKEVNHNGVFQPNENDNGGQIAIGNLLTVSINTVVMEGLAHELFHAYHLLKQYKGNLMAYEFGAYIIGIKVVRQINPLYQPDIGRLVVSMKPNDKTQQKEDELIQLFSELAGIDTSFDSIKFQKAFDLWKSLDSYASSFYRNKNFKKKNVDLSPIMSPFYSE